MKNQIFAALLVAGSVVALNAEEPKAVVPAAKAVETAKVETKSVKAEETVKTEAAKPAPVEAAK